MPMIFQHYLMLLKCYRRRVLGIVAVITLLGAAASTALLIADPKYTTAASVVLVPTDAELVFAKQETDGPRWTGTLAETHIEYLTSRPVAEAVVDKALETISTDKEPQTGFSGMLSSTIVGARKMLLRAYRVMNSGYYVEQDFRHRAVTGLRGGTRVENVPGSFILEIKVTLPSAKLAAFAANALAEAYVERATRDLELSADRLESFVEQRIDARSASLNDLMARQHAMESELGVTSSDQQVMSLMDSIRIQRGKKIDAETEIRELEAELLTLRDTASEVRRGSVLDQVAEKIASVEGRISALKGGQSTRNEAIRDLERRLVVLDKSEQSVDGLSRQRTLLENELSGLYDQLFQARLVKTSALPKVRVISPASEPVYPSFPRVLDYTVLSFIAGLLITVFVLVCMDAFSGTIKTEVDLQRVVGQRSLGELDSKLPKLMTRANPKPGKILPRLEQQRAHLLRRLTLLGGLDTRRIFVTGFMDSDDIESVALMIAASLVGGERPVLFKGREDSLYRSLAIDESTGAIQIGEQMTRFADDEAIRIERIASVSEGFAWEDIARRSPALICGVPAGKVADQDVEDFQAKALHHQLPATCFLLLGEGTPIDIMNPGGRTVVKIALQQN